MILIIIASVSFALFFNVNNMHKTLYIDVKPFKCVPCLSFWAAILMFLIPSFIVEFIATVFLAGIIGAVLYRLFLRL